jgi:hypothetical protein
MEEAYFKVKNLEDINRKSSFWKKTVPSVYSVIE